MVNQKVKEWVELVLKTENLRDYIIDVHGANNQDGYLGNVTFVTVNGKTENGNNKTLNLVIKSSKESENFRKQVPIKETFEKEIYVYDTVKAAFDKFQQEKGITEPVEILPHCYVTRSTDTSELLILENIKPKGFTLWDRMKPMPSDYLKIILETYGKWHALSFALKQQQPDVFENLTAQNNHNIFNEWIEMANMFDYIKEKFDMSQEYLIRNNDVEVLEKIQFDKDYIKYIVKDMLLENPEHHVILHGDCWTNNFMFKLDNSAKPTEARIIDWQCSGLGSPVIDLSFFLYSCCSKENYQDFEKLLRFYYDSLAEELRKLGSEPEEIFTFSDLKDHWKKFSKYGIVITAFILRFSLCDLDEPPDFAAAANRGQDLLSSYYFTLKNEDRYLERVTNNLLHYVQNI